MFRHLMKGLPWQLGPLPLLLLLLIIGRINTSAAAKSTSSEVNANTPSGDYESDEDETAAPAEQNQPKGPLPFFEKPVQTLYLGHKNKTQINCSAKNFNDERHSILWFKGNQNIANGNHPLSNEYQVDTKMNLIIEHITKDTPGNYTCQINPGKINQTTIVKAGEDPGSKTNDSAKMNLPILTIILLSSIFFVQLLDI